jgi:hypothetical protein
MPEASASGRVQWNAASGIKIVEIRSPAFSTPRAVLVSTNKPTTRHTPEVGEDEAAFVRRVTKLATGRSDCYEISIFLPVPKRRIVRERLDD